MCLNVSISKSKHQNHKLSIIIIHFNVFLFLNPTRKQPNQQQLFNLLTILRFNPTVQSDNYKTMELENIEKQLDDPDRNDIQEQLQPTVFRETRYRWVIVGVAALLMVFNGLLNNIIIPISTKLSIIYDQPSQLVNAATIVSFLLFCIANVPANIILDQRGIRFGFMIGLSLYVAGIVLACFVNVWFPFLLVGYLCFTIGQPFILNTPAQIATYWFFPQNRALATSILVGANIIGSGLGFAIPSLAVSQTSTGNVAKRQIFSLYLGYAITCISLLIITSFLIRAKPKTPTTNIAKKQRLSLRQTISHIRKDHNLWKFYVAYFMIYGTFQTFASSANFVIKPFGYTDLQISMAAVFLIIMGTIGAVLSSLYLKRTRKYKKVITICTIGATSTMLLLIIQLHILPHPFFTSSVVAMLGFFVTPIVPISYELGCEMAFPIGEAQVTGLLNACSLIWAFISDSILTAAIGFGTTLRSSIFILMLAIFVGIGSVIYFFIKFDLKRKRFEQSQDQSTSPNKIDNPPNIDFQMSPSKMQTIDQGRTSTTDSQKSHKYDNLNQQRIN